MPPESDTITHVMMHRGKCRYCCAFHKNSYRFSAELDKVRIYRVADDIAPLIHEIRKIGTNLNQLAYFSNIGHDSKVRAEIGAIRQTNEAVMKRILAFLDEPKFSIKGVK